MALLRRNLLLALSFFKAAEALAYSLHSDAGAVSNEVEDIDVNPANAGYMNQSRVSLKLNTFSRQMLKFRFPQTAVERRPKNEIIDTGISLDTLPFNYVASPLQGLGIGILAAPPLSTDTKLNLPRLPIALLNTVDFVDITVSDIRLINFFAGAVGYRLSRDFSLGMSFRYLEAEAAAEIRTSSNKAYLTQALVGIKNLSGKVGFRWSVVPRTLEFGFAANLLGSKVMRVKVKENIPAGLTPGASGKEDNSIKNPFASFVLGMKATYGIHRVHVDGERREIDKDQAAISLKDFKEKKRDLHDTFALRLGYTLLLGRSLHLHLGTSYEPSSIGAGSGKPDGLSGFGTLDLVPIVGLGDFIRPYRQYTAGLSYHYYGEGREKKKKQREIFSVSAGIAYRTATLGIDETGEQPGAYYMRKTWVPLSLTYNF